MHSKEDKMEFPIIYLESSDFSDDGTRIINKNIPNNTPVIVMAQSSKCGWCMLAKPAYGETAKKHRNIVFCVIDCMANPDVASKVLKTSPNYQGLPHYMLFKDYALAKDVIHGRDEYHLIEFAKDRKE